MKNFESKMIDLLYRYEIKNECVSEPAWEDLVEKIVGLMDRGKKK